MIDARRFVLDTNVLVSAALLPEGGVRRYEPTRLCVEIARRNGVLLVSDATLAELREVLLRPVFDRLKPRAEREAFVAATRPVYDKWKNSIGAPLVTKAEQAIAARKK